MARRLFCVGARSVVVTYKLPMLVPRVRFPVGALLLCLQRSSGVPAVPEANLDAETGSPLNAAFKTHVSCIVVQKVQKYSAPGLNRGPLACEASVITTRPAELDAPGPDNIPHRGTLKR